MEEMNGTAPKEKYKIMIVDDNVTNLTVARKALESIYNVIPVTSGQKAVQLLEKVAPALILLDIEMPEMDGFDTIKLIKANDATKDIPVIFLTAKDDGGSEVEGLKLGAMDYITKPFSIPLLLQRVELHIALVVQREELHNYNRNLAKMVKEQTEIIAELQHSIIHALSDMIECRDGLTGGHVARTQRYLKILVDGLTESSCYEDELQGIDVDLLVESAQLHDIGKIGIPDNILQKPGRLSYEEFEAIKEHTLIGERAIKGAMEMTRSKEFLNYAAVVAVSHHEKWDGSGYPYGLKGRDIPLIGRLMAIADVYDALVSERPYKKALSHQEAVHIIAGEVGRHFDPKLIDIFVERAALFC